MGPEEVSGIGSDVVSRWRWCIISAFRRRPAAEGGGFSWGILGILGDSVGISQQ